MSDNWNNQHQEFHQPQDQHQGDFQGNYVQESHVQAAPVDAYQPHEQHQQDQQPPVHQDWQQPTDMPVQSHVDPHAERIAALEATIAELKSSISALQASHSASTVHEPVVAEAIDHVSADGVHGDAPVADDASAALPATEDDGVETQPAAQTVADTHGDRLVAIEQELAHLRTLVGAVAHSVSAIGADVKAHADLHAETRSIVDEQHQLMRGLNYIITSAIGTLTTAAKQPK